MTAVVTDRMFPLQTSRTAPTGPRQIPWSIAELAYGEYSRQYGTGQSLERLAQRGGFGWCEMDMYYPPWRKEVSEIEQLKHKLDYQRSAVEAAHKQFHEWAATKNYSAATMHNPDEDSNPAALMRIIIRFYEGTE